MKSGKDNGVRTKEISSSASVVDERANERSECEEEEEDERANERSEDGSSGATTQYFLEG